MKTVKLEKSTVINASKEKVWEVLFADKYSRIWYALFMEGTHAITDWKLGSKVMFVDNDKNGLLGKIVANEPYKLLSIEYTGQVLNGQEDYDSEAAQQMKGGLETYRLSEKDGKVQVVVEGDMPEEMFDMMSEPWDKAMLKIKELAESK